jgi:hypothetical protein
MTITEQVLDLAEPADDAGDSSGADLASATVSPAAMKSPGLPVPDDPAAISIFTAHRVDEVLHKLSHAAERMKASRSASGDLRKYHASLLAGHLQSALKAGHDLVANIREHYPDEAKELDAVGESVGLAKAVSSEAKAATTAHLLETTLHELTHGARHALQMTEDTPEDEQEFNADHAEKHLGGAVEHAGKLEEHFKDNYPDVAGWLNGLTEVTEDAEESDGDAEHARYSKAGGGTIAAQLANAGTIGGQLL